MYAPHKRYISMENFDDAGVDDNWYPDDDSVSELCRSVNTTTTNRGGREYSRRSRPESPPYRRQARPDSPPYTRQNGQQEGNPRRDRRNELYRANRDRFVDVNDDDALKSDSNGINRRQTPFNNGSVGGSLSQQRNGVYRDTNANLNQSQGGAGSDASGGEDHELSTSDDNYFDDDDEEAGDMERQPLGNPGAHAGKLVTFYRNGDSHYKGLVTSVSKKLFPSFETLLIWLNEKVPTTTGVRHVFALPSGKEIKDTSSFTAGHSYVVSSSRLLPSNAAYGTSKERFWHNKAPSAGRIRRSEYDLFDAKGKKKSNSYPGSRAGSIRSLPPGPRHVPMAVQPRILTISSNTNRKSCKKVILNPQTTQNFEDMLKDIGSMLDIQFKPVKTLYTLRSPQKRIQSFSHLLHLPKTVDEFLACGRELFPLELQQNAVNGEPQEVEPVELPLPKHSNSKPKYHHSNRSCDGSDEPARSLPDPRPDTALTPYNDEPDHRDPSKDIDADRFSPPRSDVRAPREPPRADPPMRSQENGISHRDPPPPAKKDKPYRKKLPELESVKVHIHGNLREFFVPRYGLTESDGSKSEKNIELNWVYGYRGLDGRNNLFTLPTGELLYYVAGVAVIYNRERHCQRHYLEHNEDITCMAVHVNGINTLVATGQMAGKSATNTAHVRVWDPARMVTRCVIGTSVFQVSVTALSFSGKTGCMEDGSLLLVLDDSNKHTLSVWEWKKGRMVGKTATTADSVVWGTFHPQEHTTIITYGKQHVYFWKLFWDNKHDGQARILRDKKSGLMPVDDMPRFVTAVGFSPDGDVLTGDSNGCITVWSRDTTEAFLVNQRCSEPMKHAHNKSIFALCMSMDGTLLSGAGSEIRAWDSTNHYRATKDRLIPEGSGSIRTLILQDPTSTDGALYIGTTSNSIIDGSLQKKFTTIVQGHSEELWAVCTHPDEQMFVTAGYDQYVCMWDMNLHKPAWKTYIEKPGMSVALDPFGRLVVVGTRTGRFIVLDAYSGSHMASVQVTNEALDGIRFSPDGSHLAMGSHDGNVYVYEVLEEGQAFKKHRGGVLKGHNNYVNHLDWSKDGKYLQTVSGDYDLLFWDTSSMKEIPAQMMREVEWASQSCVLSYNILGAWSNLRDGEDITTVARNHQGDELMVGDNMGHVRVYRFPCTAERPEYHLNKQYSGKINKVEYSYNDRFVIASGGSDAGLLQWAVVENRDYL